MLSFFSIMFLLWCMYCDVLFTFNCYLLTYFVHWSHKKSQKKEKSTTRSTCRFIRVLVWVGLCLCLFFLHSCLDLNHLFFKLTCDLWMVIRNVSCLLIHSLCRSSLCLNSIAMHLFLFKIFRDSVLLINNSLKRGDMETEAWSSVSPSPQLKMKLKLTV